MKGNIAKRIFAYAMAFAMGITSAGAMPSMEVQAAGNGVSAPSQTDLGMGSIAPRVVGEWSYWNGSQMVFQSNASLLDKLPYEGSSYRYTTDKYNAENGAFDTNNWASSFAWDLNGTNPYSNSVYAIPLAFRASVEGGAQNCIQVTAPSALSDVANNTYTMQMPANGTCTDFFVKTPFNTANAKVDAISDWGYDVVMEDVSDASRYMKTTMVQGSIFAYFEMVNTNSVILERGKQLPAAVSYVSPDGKSIVVRCYDNAEEDYDYYAFYGAEGTVWNTEMNGDRIGKITGQFGGSSYFSMAYLGSTVGGPNDGWAEEMANAYYPYAYNFVTDTRSDYSYDENTSTVNTTYSYSFDRKRESTSNDTIMGILPHHFKNMSSSSYLPYTYNTIRGTMMTMAGNSFTTSMKYSGVLPYMPDVDPEANGQLQDYLSEYINEFGDDFFQNYEGIGDTYWDGKGLNRLVNAMVAAYDADDTALGDRLLEELKKELEDWFTFSGDDDDAYFYYDDKVKSLFGFPQNYCSVDQINDHHFHYGYFIYAAAQVAMRLDEWGDNNQYGEMVNQLIYDIACPERNNPDSAYPYLRAFAPYEGHSWASGHANFELGNNQESSSEALNAWTGIIMWGEATNNKELRDLGIYLYTTEVAAVDAYWYDVDGDVLSDAYKYDVPIQQVGNLNSNSKLVHNSAAIVWGGAYTYATWFDGNPLYIQGINLLPMNPACFYLAGNKDYVKLNYDNAYANAAAAGADMSAWIDIYMQYYAFVDPDAALEKFNSAVAEGYGVEGGETKAHTYHFIQSLKTHGVPDTSITSNCALSGVFYDEANDVYTYAVYNANAEERSVTFSDGKTIKAAPRTMTVVSDKEPVSGVSYKVNHYTQNASGDFKLYRTSTLYGTAGERVEANPISISGYCYDSNIEGTKNSGIIQEDGSLQLDLYYTRESYSITYELNGGVMTETNPDSYIFGETHVLKEPVREDYRFTGWHTDAALSKKITEITDKTSGNLTLYAGWQSLHGGNVDEEKGVSYTDGKLNFYVKNVDASYKVNFYTDFYKNESDAKQKTNDPDVAGLPGYTMNYDAEQKMFVYTMDASQHAGEYMPYRFNVINTSGVAELSAWGIYQIPEKEEPPVNVAYRTEYYLQNNDKTGYDLYQTITRSGEVGANVQAEEKTYEGYVLNKNIDGTVKEGKLEAGKELVLKLYYEKNTEIEDKVPDQVVNVKAVYADGTVTVTWDAAEGASDYTVIRYDPGTNQYIALTYRADGTTYHDNSVEPGKTYRYRITAWYKNANGKVLEAKPSEPADVSVEARTTTPEQVQGIQASYADNAVTVTWEPSEGAVNYTVNRYDAESGAYKVLTYCSNGISFVDNTVEKGHTYRYRITAWCKDGNGNVLDAKPSEAAAVSVEVADVVLTDVTNLKAEYQNGKIILNWDASEGAVDYTVNRYDSETKTYTALTYRAGGTTYTDENIKDGVTYTYRITAWCNGSDGKILSVNPSNPATVKEEVSGVFSTIKDWIGI